MGKIRGWKKIIDNKIVNTGGGFVYYLTFYRNERNPLKQVEIWKDVNESEVGLNIGTRYENSPDAYDPIQGDYIYTGSFKSVKDAKAKAHRYMRGHPNG